MSFSKIILMGNLTADPDQRTTPNGQELTSFSLAVNTRNGRDESTAFYRCTMWGKRGEAIARYVSKGQPLLVSGTLSVRSYQAKDGTERQSLEVNVDDFSFVGGRNGNNSGATRTKEDDTETAASNMGDDL
ncbi:MAG: single-stranded DNA-binding protein, partial [Candidatus Saccharibacteria bacterium]|nr:single-stranded DNA-binding protein [Candidatus Saccharibacteria bacterium]